MDGDDRRVRTFANFCVIRPSGDLLYSLLKTPTCAVDRFGGFHTAIIPRVLENSGALRTALSELPTRAAPNYSPRVRLS